MQIYKYTNGTNFNNLNSNVDASFPQSAWVLKIWAGGKASVGPPGSQRHWVGGSVYDEQVCGGEMRENEKQNGSCAVERGRMEEVKAAV